MNISSHREAVRSTAQGIVDFRPFDPKPIEEMVDNFLAGHRSKEKVPGANEWNGHRLRRKIVGGAITHITCTLALPSFLGFQDDPEEGPTAYKQLMAEPFTQPIAKVNAMVRDPEHPLYEWAEYFRESGKKIIDIEDNETFCPFRAGSRGKLLSSKDPEIEPFLKGVLIGNIAMTEEIIALRAVAHARTNGTDNLAQKIRPELSILEQLSYLVGPLGRDVRYGRARKAEIDEMLKKLSKGEISDNEARTFLNELTTSHALGEYLKGADPAVLYATCPPDSPLVQPALELPPITKEGVCAGAPILLPREEVAQQEARDCGFSEDGSFSAVGFQLRLGLLAAGQTIFASPDYLVGIETAAAYLNEQARR